jgi:sulfide dehydrogenase cytochrome subunit
MLKPIMKITPLKQIILGLFALFFSSQTIANQSVIMEHIATTILASSCSSCHGPNGVSSGPSIPSIAGIPKEYFLEIMLAFKLNQLPNSVMGDIAKAFSRDELTQLADHFSKKRFVPSQQPFDPVLAKKGAKLHEEFCEGCHEKGGSSAKDKEISILAGQHLLYLRWTLDDFKRNKRRATRKMAKKMRKLLKLEGNAGLDALAHYYASQQP